MTLPSNDRLPDVVRELEELRTELAKVRDQRTQYTTGQRGRIGLLAASLIAVSSWAWSAPTDIENRLSILESLIRKGPGGTTQVTAPFDVMGPDGKAILGVGSGASTAGAVAIWSSPDKAGRVVIRSDKGITLAELGTSKEGYGVVTTADEEGVTRAQLYGSGKVAVLNKDKKMLAGIGAGNDLGEVSVVGRVAVLDNNGAIRATLNNSGQVIVSDELRKPVARMEASGKGRGRMMISGDVIAVDEKENKAATLELTNEGRGRVLVWNKGNAVASMEVDDKNGNAGALMAMNPEGKVVAKIGSDATNGVLFAADAKGTIRTQLKGSGEAVVFDEDKNPVATMMAVDKSRGRVSAVGEVITVDKKGEKVAGLAVTNEGRGQVAVWNKKEKAAVLEVDDQDSGVVIVTNGDGKAIVKLGAGRANNAGMLNVMNSQGKEVARMSGGGTAGGSLAVANSASMVQAEVYISDDGRGLFQVNKNQRPIAVLTEKLERPGGLVQLYNLSGQGVANLTVGEGGGYFQLTNNDGVATVEAGTLADGKGTVRVGPKYKCSEFQSGSALFGKGIKGLPDCLVGSTKEGATFKDRVTDQFPFGDPPFYKK
jgi:hypothetical protein